MGTLIIALLLAIGVLAFAFVTVYNALEAASSPKNFFLLVFLSLRIESISVHTGGEFSEMNETETEFTEVLF